MSRTSRRLILMIVAGVAVLAGISIYADVGELSQRLAGFQWWAFAAACGLALVNYAIRFGRWSLYLKSRDISAPTGISALIFLSGFALSITPGKLGELIKSYLLRASCAVPITRSAPIVVAERITDLLALLVLGLVGVALYGVARSMVVAGSVAIVVGLFFLAWPPAAHRAI
ncbi:MAG: lysylphosphatidylglycerol synthase domain-containing protein, partial [Myxococcota bacterium]